MLIKQFSCREGSDIDLRQAHAVLKYKPDVIIWEAPNNSRFPGLLFNKYSPIRKPFPELVKIQENLRRVAKKYPWVLSDVQVYENIKQLWGLGRDVKIYHVDAPSELLQQTLIHNWNTIPGPHRRGTHLIWWIFIYLREQIMAKNISAILATYKKSNKVVLVCMQKFHWINVQFLLSNPGRDRIWKYYFGKFKNLKPSEVGKKIKKENAVLYKYWERDTVLK